MVKRFLVTTALEETWPKDPEIPVLFLGEWCRIYSRKERWSRMNAEVLPYHWDDRDKLYQDYQYLQKLYEKLLADLSYKLNQIHNVEHTQRYWRILIGPWLGYFIQMLFDRWFMLKKAIETKEGSVCRVINRDPITVAPNDMKHFNQMYIEDDWNEVIYGQLLELCWGDKINIELVQSQSSGKKNANNSKQIRNRTLKRYVETGIILFNKLFPKNDGYFFISSYLPLKEDFKLQIRLGQFPKLWRQQSVPTTNPDIRQRQWLLGGSELQDGSFELIMRKLIPQHIPTAYLEGYNKLLAKAKLLNWPKRPKVIFTSNAYSSDDLFKVWAADKREFGTPLVIGQHGGHFGMTPFAFHEEHQIKIADKWLSWGWSDKTKPQITPVGNIKIVNRKGRYNHKGGLLMVEMAMPRYSYHLYAVPVSRQYIGYLDDQFTFVEALPELIYNELMVRLNRSDYGWEQKARWNEKHPNIKLDTGARNIKQLISKSRIYISTYNATTFLESFALNVPTVMFWNPKHWELHKSAKPYFEQLKEVGVFHETPESAAKHITKIWDNVDDWWTSKSVATALNYFCENYNKTNKNIVNAIQKELINLRMNKVKTLINK